MPVRSYRDAKGCTRYAVEFQQGGARVHRRLHPTATRGDAVRLEASLRQSIFAGSVERDPPLEEAILTWLQDTLTDKKDKIKPVQNARLLAPFIAGKRMSEIGTVAEEAARTWASLRPATINRRLCVLKAAAKHSWRSGATAQNLSSRVRLMREENRREVYLTPKQIRLLASCAPSAKCRAAIMIAAYTGLRAGELLALTSAHISKDTLTVARSKTGKQRKVPITRVALRYLSELPLGLSYWELRRDFVSARKKAKLPQVRFHDLRHTTASMLVNAGVPLEVIGEVLGHRSLQTTQRYAHLEQATLRAAMKRLV